MKMLRTLLLFTTTALLIASCQKEVEFAEDSLNNNNNNNNNSGSGGGVDFVGTWRFVGQKGTTGTRSEISEGGFSMVNDAVLNYVAKNPTGTVTFTSNKMTCTNVGYVMSGVSHNKMWMDGVLLSETSEEMELDTPPFTGETGFVKIGNDSLRYNSTPFSMPDMPSMGGEIIFGARLRMSNDTLYARVRFNTEIDMPEDMGTTFMHGDMELALVK